MNDVDIDGGRLTARNADVRLHSGQSLRRPMSTESQLREKLRKIEALFAGAGTAGERLAAEAALERVRARLGELSRQEPLTPVPKGKGKVTRLARAGAGCGLPCCAPFKRCRQRR